MPDRFYITTPIYYVNDRPHIGHVYTTTVADVIARHQRLLGRPTFFLTGTDEHAAKVVEAAESRGLSPQAWADQNAAEFENTFKRLGIANDDFIRTSQDRHKDKVVEYLRGLIASGDVYLGEYEGWYDPSQEEYVPESKAKEYDYKSPITGKPLIRKKETNDFFRLSRYEGTLVDLIESDTLRIQPVARKNEILSRLRDGLSDTPISRSGVRGWGIPVPEHEDQTVYVWIDALFNYLSTVETPERKDCWPADVHLIAKDILWFHSVIWPAMLLALGRELPKRIYAHSFWISEGTKMSKSLGNFIDLERIDAYVERFSLDALRYFLVTQGPMGATDSDFTESTFIDLYNSDLANTLGNCFSRVANMTAKYFDGHLPAPSGDRGDGDVARASRIVKRAAEEAPILYEAKMADLDLAAAVQGVAMKLVHAIDRYIESTQPFKLIKEEANRPAVADVIYHCAEALRVASLLLWPTMPTKMEELWSRMGLVDYAPALSDRGCGQFKEWVAWGGLQPGAAIEKGDPLFMRDK